MITVALAGTAAALTADFVCDGSDDQVEINAAVAAAAALGGGTVRLAAGTYATSSQVLVLGDGVALEGDADGGTVITASAGWQAIALDGAPEAYGMVSFVGVDGFAARHLTIEAGDTLANGLIAVTTGAAGVGEISSNGVFEYNTVRMAQGHTYSIWSLRSQGMVIANNVVEGGATSTAAHSWQEGIEVYGGRDVVIRDNVVTGIGNAAINIGGLADQTPDTSIENITISGNHVSDSRVGVFIGTTAGQYGNADARHILIEDNVFEGLFELGLHIRNWTGDAANPVHVEDVVFRDNDVQMAYAESAGFVPSAILFLDESAAGATLRDDVVVANNTLSVVKADAAPEPLYLFEGYAPFVAVIAFSDFALADNRIDLSALGDQAKGVIVYDSDNFDVSGNTIVDSGRYAIELSSVSAFSIDGNVMQNDREGSREVDLYIAHATADGRVDGNTFARTGDSGAPVMAVVGDSQTLVAEHNAIVSAVDVVLSDQSVDDATLTGDAKAVTGNANVNVLTGNDRDNVLDGGAGADTLIGGPGNDRYLIDDAGDTIVEAVGGGGKDVALSSVSYVLAQGVEIERLATTDRLSTAAIDFTGNALNQTLTGNAGANRLTGGGGADLLIGLGGDDVYHTDNAATRILEEVGGGYDTLLTGVSYVLASDVEVELLSADRPAGTDAIDLTGNAVDQILQGNAGANRLDGGGGIDTLIGYGGDDVYRTDSASTRIVEEIGGGNDTLRTSVSFVLAQGVEIETLAASDRASAAAIDLTGNAVDQTIEGNAGANRLDGGGGRDTLVGYGGADAFAFTTRPVRGSATTIADFEGGIDRILLDRAIFAALDVGQLTESQWSLGRLATDADDRILYDRNTGALRYDPDGTGPQEGIKFAVVEPHSALTLTDIFVF